MRKLGEIARVPFRHRPFGTLSGPARRRMYEHLLALVEEEERVKDLLNLPTPARLSVVDEERVTVLQPRDRTEALSDVEMRKAEQEHRQRAAEEAREGDLTGDGDGDGADGDQGPDSKGTAEPEADSKTAPDADIAAARR